MWVYLILEVKGHNPLDDAYANKRSNTHEQYQKIPTLTIL
jgi:hypothetical protein